MNRCRPLLLLLLCSPALLAQEPATGTPPKEAGPWRLKDALGGLEWFQVSGEQRSRYESLHNQFRYRRVGSAWTRPFGNDEDVLALRTSLMIAGGTKAVSAGLEILDSRQLGNVDSSFVDTTMVNTVDILQAYVDFHFGEWGDGKHRLRVGREAVDLGNRRLMARNAYRNTINAFTGIDWMWESKENSVRAFWTMPTERLPDDFESLKDNKHDWDQQSLDLQFAGIYYDHKIDPQTNFELYLFGLEERGANTRQRELLTPGFRLNHRAKPGAWNYELEGTFQFGESKESTSATAPMRDHVAGFATAALGYTFDMPWQPNLTAAYFWASGDQDPNDNKNERYDTLFGARRFEYGPTGIWGAIARTNMSSPELRMTVRPTKTIELMAAYRVAWLASERDTWTTAGLRNSAGTSGRHVANQLEGRLRWQVIPKNLQLELGAAYLQAGSFQEDASEGLARDATYGYVEVTWWF